MAGTPGSGLQRGQDHDRSPLPGVRFPGVQRPPIRRGVTDQTICGGDPANPGTAPHRDARTARIQRGGGPGCAHPHHSGVGGLLPGRGVVQDVQIPGQLPVEAHLQVGHPNKPNTWVCARYFGKFNKFRNDHWVFGDAASGAYLVKFSWTDIVRHTLVTGGASPDDPALAEYWSARRRRIKPPLDGYTLRLLAKQNGRCPLCGDELLSADQPPQSPDEWERWWLQITRKAIVADYLVHHGRSGPPGENTTRLAHATCQREHQAHRRRSTALQSRTVPGLA